MARIAEYAFIVPNYSTLAQGTKLFSRIFCSWSNTISTGGVRDISTALEEAVNRVVGGSGDGSIEESVSSGGMGREIWKEEIEDGVIGGTLGEIGGWTTAIWVLVCSLRIAMDNETNNEESWKNEHYCWSSSFSFVLVGAIIREFSRKKLILEMKC